jgi:primosomal protein N' (replication factor Y)
MYYYYNFIVTGIDILLTYKSREEFKIGDVFLLPVSGKKRPGVLFEKIEKPKNQKFNIKEIEGKDFTFVSLPPSTIFLMKWIREFYRVSYDKILPLFLPFSTSFIEKTAFEIKRDKNPVNLTEKEKEIFEFIKSKKKVLLKTLVKKFGAGVNYTVHKLLSKNLIHRTYVLRNMRNKKIFSPSLLDMKIPQKPTKEQEKIIKDFETINNKEDKKIFLIHGVTGSGKTFIYREIALRILKEGKSVLILVPEVSLMPQIASYFKFKEYPLFFWGFILRAEEKLNILEKTLSKNPVVLIGARSASFVPFNNLGVIIIDEEQEESFKEKEKEPFYHAREIVLKRAEIEKIPVVIGSATPSLEIYRHSIEKGRYYFIPKRIKGYTYPEIDIVSLKDEPMRFYLSVKILEEIENTLKKGKKVILFLNKRGFAHFIQCRTCGFVPQCPNCSISLTYYKKKGLLVCHYCSWKEEGYSRCPKCFSEHIKSSSYGTEKLEEELKVLFPNYKVSRMDRDFLSTRKKIFELHKKLKRGEVDILIGTQMVVKGLDNPLVALVGVLYADQEMNFPDFRAKERMFSRLLQVTGRVRKGGRSIIQTYNPEDSVFKFLINSDIRGFYDEELKERELNLYPPFCTLLLIEARRKKKEEAEEVLFFVKNKLKRIVDEELILGPAFPPIERMKGLFRSRLLLKVKRSSLLPKIISSIPENLKLRVDFSPYDFL